MMTVRTTLALPARSSDCLRACFPSSQSVSKELLGTVGILIACLTCCLTQIQQKQYQNGIFITKNIIIICQPTLEKFQLILKHTPLS